MKMIHILPELEEGGVERHVLWLSEELSARGHEVLVVSAGGKMLPLLAPGVSHRSLPVHKKNPILVFLCARRLARLAGQEGWQLFHAHSRVPAWIAYWASRMAGRPLVVTAHVVFGNQSRWIYRPYRKADRVLCVSAAVEDGMQRCFSDNTRVVLNGMPPAESVWQRPEHGPCRLLFIGRLAASKGIQDIIEILPLLEGSWTLDIVGDGPLFPHLRGRIEALGLSDRVFLHGFRDDTDDWLARCSCLLFPSYTEGMPLTLARAVQMEVPVLASDIPPVAEMAGSRTGLLHPGESAVWLEAIQKFLNDHVPPTRFPTENIPTIKTMTDEVEKTYFSLIANRLDR